MYYEKIFKRILNEEEDDFDKDVIQFVKMGSGFIIAPMILKFIDWLKSNKSKILIRLERYKKKNYEDKYWLAADIFMEYSKEKYNTTHRNVKIYSTEEKKILDAVFTTVWHDQRKWV